MAAVTGVFPCGYCLYISVWYCLLLSITEPAKLIHSEHGNIESDDSEKTVFLKCIASGVPRPTIKWYNSRSKETVQGDEEAPDGAGNYMSKLTLESEEDTGDYSCVVENKHSDGPIQHSFAALTASELIKIFIYIHIYSIYIYVCIVYAFFTEVHTSTCISVGVWF